MSTDCLSVAELMLLSGAKPKSKLKRQPGEPGSPRESEGCCEHLSRRMFGGGQAEMIVRLLVLFLHVQGAGELEPNTQQAWIAIEDPAECILSPPIIPRFVAPHSCHERFFDGGVEIRYALRLCWRRSLAHPEPQPKQETNA